MKQSQIRISVFLMLLVITLQCFLCSSTDEVVTKDDVEFISKTESLLRHNNVRKLGFVMKKGSSGGGARPRLVPSSGAAAAGSTGHRTSNAVKSHISWVYFSPLFALFFL
ncbi:hypothetical protein RND81_06G175200 [Saponaria officinalis]|uniref:Transmembrane protein n=1 Tax=Saponaria officinalis TaxID=3572 RepID=A0AAW1K7X6_SAPOF